MKNFLSGAFLIIWAFSFYYSGTFMVYWGFELELGYLKIPLSLGLCILGVYTMISKQEEEKQICYYKCPKCKTSYTYSNLKDGMCPTCSIKTIEIEEYYKKYPDELEDV